MRINIASSGGRFHLLDLARELDKRGHIVRFYSYTPTSRANKFGLRKECNKSYFLLALPFIALIKITRHSFWALYLFHRFFDYYTAWTMKPCDVFIGHSPMHVYALKYAKRKYNALVILERGTSHVKNYIRSLMENGKKEEQIMPKMFLVRDLKGYELADYISVASSFVKNSFVKENINNEKIFVNPYGVDLHNFYPTECIKDKAYDLIFVGQWCRRKGCDLLLNVCKENKLRLLHVGAITDVPFPANDANFTDVGIVDETELINYYKKAKVFILPSREDGFGLVLIQAMSCGLPIVCSKYTGGPDLQNLLHDKKWITIIESLQENEIKKAIFKALSLANTQNGIRNYAKHDIENISWEAYGKRYDEFLKTHLK